MTIEKLHKLLSELIKDGHGSRLVVLSRDEEGNEYSELHSVELVKYSEQDEDVWPNDADDAPDGVTPAIALWPIG